MKALPVEVIDFVKKSTLGYVATVRPDGKPNLSFVVGKLTVFDDHHLIYADASTQDTLSDLTRNPEVAIEVMDATSKKGYRFRGKAHIVHLKKETGSYLAFYEKSGLKTMTGNAKNFVLIDVESHEAFNRGVTSPLYNLWKF